MNRTLIYYNYSKCFTHYTERIMTIRQAKIRGEVIVQYGGWGRGVALAACLRNDIEFKKLIQTQYGRI